MNIGQTYKAGGVVSVKHTWSGCGHFMVVRVRTSATNVGGEISKCQLPRETFSANIRDNCHAKSIV